MSAADEFQQEQVRQRAADLLGGCGLSQINRNHRFANLYYWVRTSRTRQGVARRAIRLAARFGIESLGLQRVEVVVQVGNVASMRAAEGAGAQREGVLRTPAGPAMLMKRRTHPAAATS